MRISIATRRLVSVTEAPGHRWEDAEAAAEPLSINQAKALIDALRACVAEASRKKYGK